MEFESKFNEFTLTVNDLVCNRFGFAEFFASNYDKLNIISINALDIGCGVGPISIYLAKKGIKVDAIDINPLATKLCMRNLIKHNVNKIVKVISGNFTGYNFNDKYDVIISNPPIDVKSSKVIDKESLERIQNESIDVELFTFLTNSWKDEKQLDLVSNIFINAKHILKDDGKIILIFGDIDNDNYKYIQELAVKYDLKIVNHIFKEIDATSVGLPKSYNTILAHILVLML